MDRGAVVDTAGADTGTSAEAVLLWLGDAFVAGDIIGVPHIRIALWGLISPCRSRSTGGPARYGKVRVGRSGKADECGGLETRRY